MGTSFATQMRFLADQVRWYLERPHDGDDRRFASINRSLNRLLSVYKDHVEALKSPAGRRRAVPDSDLLPFTREARIATALRQRQRLVSARLQDLAALFAGATALFTVPHQDASPEAPPEAWQGQRGKTVLRFLELCIADALLELEACLRAANDTDPD
jgi:hypothetical protein